MEHPKSTDYPHLLDINELKEIFLPDLREWRDTYKDDLPDNLLAPEDPNYHKYKCRTNWFNAFEKVLRLAVPHLHDPLYSEVIDYIENVFTQIDWKKFRTKEDIEKANQILHKVTAWLETEK